MSGYLSAIYSDDISSMYRSLRDLLIPGRRTNLEEFHDQFVLQTREWMRRSAEQHERPIGEHSPLIHYMIAVLRCARENDLRIPTGILSIYRALLTTELVADELGGGVMMPSVARRFFSAATTHRTGHTLDPDQLFSLASSFISLLRDAPAKLSLVA